MSQAEGRTVVPPAAIWAAGFIAHRVLPGRHIGGLVGTASRSMAVPVLAASGVFGLSSVASFLRRGTTVSPLDPEDSRELVADGVNRFSRNPMYLGMAGSLLAHAMWQRRPLSMVPVALFIMSMNRWQVPIEETALERRFGDDYREYCRQTPRWISNTEMDIGSRERW